MTLFLLFLLGITLVIVQHGLLFGFGVALLFIVYIAQYGMNTVLSAGIRACAQRLREANVKTLEPGDE